LDSGHLVNSRLQSPNISKSYSFFFLFWLEKKREKKEGCSRHISLSLRVGLFFPFLLWGFKKKMGSCWLVFCSVSFISENRKKIKRKRKII